MKIDHIGYLVDNIEKGISVFESLGYHRITDVIIDDIEYDGHAPRNVYLCFMENEGLRIELVSPINEKSDVIKTLKRQGEGPYHICYQTNNLTEEVLRLKKESWIIIKQPEKAVAFNYAKVSFLFKKGAGLIELVEVLEDVK